MLYNILAHFTLMRFSFSTQAKQANHESKHFTMTSVHILANGILSSYYPDGTNYNPYYPNLDPSLSLQLADQLKVHPGGTIQVSNKSLCSTTCISLLILVL